MSDDSNDDELIVNLDEVEPEGPQELVPGVLTTLPELREAAKPDGNLYVNYTLRGPRDVVLSGPILGGWGPGRYYSSRRVAYFALVERFGENRVQFVDGLTRGRWGYLIKNLKPEVA